MKILPEKKIKNIPIKYLIILGLLTGVIFLENVYLRIFLGIVLFTFIIIQFIAKIVKHKELNSKLSESRDQENFINEKEKEEEIKPNGDVARNDKILTADDIKQEFKNAVIKDYKPIDLREQYIAIASEPIPFGSGHDTQFNFVLDKILDIIRTILASHSVIYFWYNRSKNQVIFHNYVSNEKRIQNIRYELGNDLVSRVIIRNQPEYITNINSNVEIDLIKYYTEPVGIKSIVAVPVYFNEDLVGVLVADSKIEDAFGVETIFILGKFVRTITHILGIYDQKFNLDLALQQLEAILNLISFNPKSSSETELFEKFTLLADKLMEWDILSIVLYEPDTKHFVLKKVINKTGLNYAGEGLVIDLDKTLVGSAIQKVNSIKIDDAGEDKYFLFKYGQITNYQGTLIVVPFFSLPYISGAIVIESLKKYRYSENDVRMLEKIAQFLASQLDAILNIKLLNKYLYFDLDTLLLRKENFERRVQEELNKFRLTNLKIGFAYIQVDHFERIIKENSIRIIPKIAKYITSYLNAESDDLMLLGRVGDARFGVLFLNKEDADAFLWCEKIRQSIAKNLFSFEGKTLRITVSIGYTSGQNHQSTKTLFKDAEFALNNAIKEGGNKVKRLI